MGAAPALALVVLLGQSAAVEPRALKRGVELFDQLRFDEAATSLRGVLRSHPHPKVAAKARLYLGLIDLNLADEVRGRQELRRALELDPACVLPVGLSPKIQEVFDSVRKQVVAAPPQPAIQSAPPPPVLTTAPPPPVPELAPPPPEPTAMPTVASAEPESPSHWPAYVVGGGALALLGVGIGLGVSSNSTLSRGNSASDAGTAYSLQQSANSQALWADIFYGASLLAAGGGVWLFFSESSRPALSAAAVPLPGGGAVAVRGAF
jgi:hypothetical protein